MAQRLGYIMKIGINQGTEDDLGEGIYSKYIFSLVIYSKRKNYFNLNIYLVLI